MTTAEDDREKFRYDNLLASVYFDYELLRLNYKTEN